MIKNLILLFFIAGVQIVFSQESYSVNAIPKELKENANAVIRSHDTSVEIIALDNMIITQRRVVTVLNRFGDRHMDTYEYYDDSRRIQKLSVLVLDRNGGVIKKYKKADFKDASAVSGGQMYTENRVKYLNYHPTSYPYTIVFESTVKEKSTAFLNSWSPIEGYYVSLEQSTYKLVNHTNSKYKFKGYNLEGYDFKLDDKKSELKFSAEKLKAVERESLSPDFSTIMPWVRFVLNNFELKGVSGNSNSWLDYGKWRNDKLLKGRDVLDDTTIKHIDLLTENAKTEKDKIKLIYKYVQDNTRYVGVQLGIGGWEPIDAKEVDKVKYGDCKGLTNYTKALLKSQNIESYYSVVFAGSDKVNFDKEFVSMQGNHVFLNVPLEEETIWLECTSQTIPFGFLGDFTDDRDVLVITPNGGEIKHTPIYDESDNRLKTQGDIVINEFGGMEADIKIESSGLQYDSRYGLERLSSEKQKSYYLDEWKYLNGIKINSFAFKNDKDKVSFMEQLNVSTNNYATKAGDKLLVAINPFNRLSGVPVKYEERKLPFQTSRSFLDTDSYVFEIPSEYIILALPENYKIDSEFGSYKIILEKKEGNKIKYTRELTLKEGVFPKEKYKSYRNFIKKIAKKDKSKFILTKQS